MKKPFIFIVLISLLLSASVDGADKNVTVKSYKVGDFSGIVSQSAVNVVIDSKVNDIIINASGSKFDIKRLTVVVKDGNLVVNYDRSNVNKFIKGSRDCRIDVTVPMRNYTKLSASGASSITSSESIKSDNLTIKTTSAASVNCSVECGTLQIDATSASSIKLRGVCDQANIKSTSASKVNCRDVVAQKAIANATSASKIALTAEKSLDLSASSAASIKYGGNAVATKVEVSSGASISKY